MNGDEDSVRWALKSEIERLGEGSAFPVVEFGAQGIIAWEIFRDRNGTPEARHWPAIRPALSDDPGVLYERELSWLTGTDSRLLLVSSSPDEIHAGILDVLLSARPDVPIYSCPTPLAEVLREVIAHIPLTCWYKLVVLRRSSSGRLDFESCQLFPPDAAHGYQQQIQIRCEPSDEHGTVFAVVAEGPATRNSFRLISLRSANIAPGTYEPTAVLLRPGHVDFRGLPAKFRAEHRSWLDLVRAVPDRLDRPPPSHLICAIEVSGTGDQVLRRVDRLEQLVRCAEGADDRVRVSLISYGPHSFDRKVPDEAARVLAWASTSNAVLSELDKLGRRSPLEDEYPLAAQLECALTEVTRLVTSQHGRPVLVTIGSRPPFPARVDSRTEILPCPYRNDWNRALQQLRGIRNIAFGAIYDHQIGEAIWPQLGRDALESADVIDVRRFAADLGLSRPALYVPFPLTDMEGT